MNDQNPLAPAPFNPTLDTPLYGLGDVVKATRLPVGTIRMWLERRILALGPQDKDASGKGSQRKFTLRTVYFAATLAEVTRLGVNPSQASKWAHIVWRLSVDRMIVPHEDMVFVGGPISDTFRIARRGILDERVIFDDDSPSGNEPDTSVIVVDISAVVRRCRSLLGLPEKIERL
jgi:hypothetical protein